MFCSQNSDNPPSNHELPLKCSFGLFSVAILGRDGMFSSEDELHVLH